jgi:hypothetical protein
MHQAKIWPLLAIAAICGIAFSASADQVVVTDEKGAKTTAADFRAHKHDGCKGMMYYMGSPTETDTYFDSMYLEIGGTLAGSEYLVEIPLSIISSVKSHARADSLKDPFFEKFKWDVVLSDGTTLTGRPVPFKSALGFDDFRGKTELGDFTIEWRHVAQLSFGSPKHEHQAMANGTHSLTLYANDSDKKELTGATFIYNRTNQNGCFDGLAYKDTIDFITDGGAKYQLTWDKIRELRFVNRANTVSVQLVGPSGTEYTGKFASALGIEGVSRVGAFDLHVVVPVASTAQRLAVEK